MTDKETEIMAESIALKTELGSLSSAFGELKKEVRHNNNRHTESLNAIRESLDVLVRVEERSVRLQEGFHEMKRENGVALQRVHERIDLTLKGSLDQQQQFTDLLMKFNDRVGKIEVTQMENKTKLESNGFINKLLATGFVLAITGTLVSKWFGIDAIT